jgi:hypothetical protein
LARRSKDVNQSRQLLSLAAIGDGMDRCEAARIGGMDRQSCGIGFIGSTFTARKVSLTIGWAGRSRVCRRISWRNWRRWLKPARIARRTGSSCWRRLDLKRVIAEKFGVAFHERYVGKLLKKLGFSPMSARPRHAQNERVVEAFKTYGPPRLQEIIRERRWSVCCNVSGFGGLLPAKMEIGALRSS